LPSEKRNKTGIIIAILGAIIFLVTTYQLDFVVPVTPETLDLSMALAIINVASVFLVAFGGIIQVMIDS